jgi:hypothetical protein
VVLDAATELESRMEFSRDGDCWEATSKSDGSLVIAVDCTQDELTLSSGMSRELMNGIQQLRKSAGLDLADAVEVFFCETEGVTVVENAVGMNVSLFEAKFKGAIPLPSRFAPNWSVVLKSSSVEVGGTSVVISICRPAVAARDDLNESTISVLSTLDPSSFRSSQAFNYSLDGKKSIFLEGTDFWVSTSQKVRAMKSLKWLQ